MTSLVKQLIWNAKISQIQIDGTGFQDPRRDKQAACDTITILYVPATCISGRIANKNAFANCTNLSQPSRMGAEEAKRKPSSTVPVKYLLWFITCT